jgi:shikimate kinase/3-dehydroquinate synthase
MKRETSNIVITGFSGTGKSLVAREIARLLGWDFIDTDNEIVSLAKKPIAEIFSIDGEEKFRELEREAIKRTSRQGHRVIATGGGAIVDSQNRAKLARNGFLVCLEARPETIYQRLFQEDSHGSEIRPLLEGDNPLERIRHLKAQRQPYYDDVDLVVNTDDLGIDDVAKEVVKGWRLLRSTRNDKGKTRNAKGKGRNDKRKVRNDRGAAGNGRGKISREKAKSGNDIAENAACWVETATQTYPIFVGYGLLDNLGEKLKKVSSSRVAIVISDGNVSRLYGDRVREILKAAGFAVNSFVVPPGEESKSINTAIDIYNFLIKKRVERDDILIALGGGMIGDLAGFVAATYLRGIPWVQVPTSLVAMVDASIGGKVAVNHHEGKNLIGAFYQPNFVLSDTQTLATLAKRELTSGWAEVVKYGLILDKEFFEFLESNAGRLIKLEQDVVSKAIIRSASLKAQVVSQDEKERGQRIILNYGHTVAHGLEAATQYSHFLHGEAVAIGMMGAAKLSQKSGILPTNVVKRQQSLLQEFGLPTTFFARDLAEIAKAMEVDKKTRAKKIRWVLLKDIGKTAIHASVPQQDVIAVLEELSQR